MKRCILVSVLSLLFALTLPLAAPFLAPGMAAAAVPSSPAPEAGEAGAETALLRSDADAVLTLLHNGEVLTLSLADYLPGVLAGEMPLAFADDALRAQAVAARTFALFRQRQGSPNHPEADVCDDPSCCQVWLDETALRERWGESAGTDLERVRAAVSATDGQYLTYDGEAILACFHASSAGYTENCAVLWGRPLPYLVSVESPETAADVPDFVSTVEVAPEEFREVILSAYPQAAITETTPPDWLGTRSLDTSGRVAGVRVGGVSIPGVKMRSLFSLRSANFTLEWTGHSFLFTVTGSGHGAGMSQYGANVMAQNHSTWQEILAHYYPGTELSALTA